MKRYIRLARQQGWRVELRKAGHLVFFPPDPDADPIFTGQAPGGRGIETHLSRLKRAGFRDEEGVRPNDEDAAA
jgi:hypothetical protein